MTNYVPSIFLFSYSFFVILQNVSMNGVLWILFQGCFVLYCIVFENESR